MVETDSVIMNSLWNGDQERFRYVSFENVDITSFEKVDMDADIHVFAGMCSAVCVRRTLSCNNGL